MRHMLAWALRYNPKRRCLKELLHTRCMPRPFNTIDVSEV
jgi:hypothetical protein